VPEVRTAVGVPVDRYIPPAAIVPMMQAFDASPAVDDMMMWDQLQWFFPRSLWKPENTPLAALHSDPHSFPDVYSLAGYFSAHAPGLGITISTDSVRRGPAELLQSALTLGDLTNGHAVLHVGAGEVKQTKPFGYKRSQGLKRLEDLLVIRDKLWESEEPVTYEGHYSNLRNASLGAHKVHRPEIWGLGGGPRLIDITTSYADGFATLAPNVWSTPEEAEIAIRELKQEVERKGRNPAEFSIGLWVTPLIHTDPGALDQALENKVMKWQSAIFGRVNQAAWRKEGIEPAFPDDWHYAMNLLPLEISEPEMEEHLAKVTPELSRKAWIMGSPQQVAAQLSDYVDAGVTWVMIADMMSMVIPPEDPAAALGRTLEVCARIKGQVPAATAA
jgi:phthiodiolone/phenolphthiodiolone dimycocerosates ketoreductase